MTLWRKDSQVPLRQTVGLVIHHCQTNLISFNKVENKKDTPLCDRYVTPEPLLDGSDGFDDEELNAGEETFCTDNAGEETPRAPKAASRNEELSYEIEITRQSLGKLR